MTLYFIIYFCTDTYMAFCMAYLYSHIYEPRDFFKHPMAASFLAGMIIQLPAPFLTTVNAEMANIFTQLSLLLPLLVFKGKIRQKIVGYFYLFMTFILSETIASFFINFIFFLQGKHALHGVLQLANDPPAMVFTSLCIICVGLLLFFSFIQFIKKFYYRMRIFLLMFLPLEITVLATMGLLSNAYGREDYPWRVAGYWVICLLCNVFLLWCFKYARREERSNAQKRRQLELISSQLQYSRELESEYRRLRRWNHDLSNHLFSLSYLVENGRYEEAEKYCRTLLDEDGGKEAPEM